ncbi:MAG: type II toxin-antitoxin system VapC family toxin [Rubrobacter sp.]|nr:type II toxin-antitoxin system VapC family toxin [Rubrobacter sp.]
MRAAVDTNIFVRFLSGSPEVATAARAALERAAADAALSVSPAVYAELVAGGRSPEAVDGFLSGKDIEVDWEIRPEVWRTAGSRYGSYAHDRRRQAGDSGPRRILADFLVGAHALHLGGATLLSTDTRIFPSYFPELRIIAPEE